MSNKRLFLILFLLLWLVGCGSSTASTPKSTEAVTLTVFAASSLTDAFTELGQLLEAQHAGTTVQFNFASSSDLATQLAEGAPGDVFASANTRQMENAVADGRIVGEPVNFLTNSLVVIVPADNPVGIESLADLANEGVKFVSAAPDVPIRGFTDQMLDNAAADPAYSADFKTAVLANLVSEEANVRQLAAKVVLGEADAGVVYKSDVTPDIADQVQVIEIPDALNVIAVYPMAAINDSVSPETAQAFLDLILSDEGQAILAKWGFGPRPEQ
ncbi:MAG: molybdate ABC transporter substrate-binding protein [Anaerolineae bacterium]|nr:molybdate ABC transporter substrate-binding protein [Anaerolineae bacterium]